MTRARWWALLPIGLSLGCSLASAEPAVAVKASEVAMSASQANLRASSDRLEAWLLRGEDQPEAVLSQLTLQTPAPAGIEASAWSHMLLRTRGLVAARSGRAEQVTEALSGLTALVPHQPADQIEADRELILATQAELAGQSEQAAQHARRADDRYVVLCNSSSAIELCDYASSWRAIRLLAIRAVGQGNLVESVALLERGLALAARYDDSLLQAWSLAWLATLNQRLGDEDLARRQLAQADRVARRHPDNQAQIRVRFYESTLALDRSEPDLARRAMEQALRLARPLSSPRLSAQIEANLSDLLRRAGRAHEALAAVEQALPVMQRHMDLRSQPLLLHNGGLARLQLGQVAQGRADLEAALRIWQQAGAKGAMEGALRETSEALAALGDVRGALEFYHREHDLRAEINRANRDAALAQIKTRYKGESEAREIGLLSRENALRAARIQTQSLMERIWLLVGVLLLLALGVAMLLLKRARDANLQLRRSEALLRVQSERDALTGLANRRHFREALAAQGAAGGFAGALLVLDIDHFKRVNDEFGHGAGDAVLVEVAKRLGQTVRANDLACRWGGEEFLVFAPELRGEGPEALAGRVLHAIGDEPVELPDGRRLRVTTSVGYASFPLPTHQLTMSWEQAVNLVDMALYTAKSMGRDRAVGLVALRADDDSALHDIERDFELARLAGDVELKVSARSESA
jgi:diguanylate cyclase (GGDEF)-like protein